MKNRNIAFTKTPLQSETQILETATEVHRHARGTHSVVRTIFQFQADLNFKYYFCVFSLFTHYQLHSAFEGQRRIDKINDNLYCGYTKWTLHYVTRFERAIHK